MAYLIEQPLTGILPFVLFLGLYFWCRRRFVLIAALLWACYVPYEFAMKLRILCSGDCNIRIDLMLIYPVLAAASVVALVIATWVLLRRSAGCGPVA